MTNRTTFALDETTTQRIRMLSTLWQVSQAEVIRRAVAQAGGPTTKPDPVAMLEQLHRSAQGLTEGDAKACLAEVRADRKEWRAP